MNMAKSKLVKANEKFTVEEAKKRLQQKQLQSRE